MNFFIPKCKEIKIKPGIWVPGFIFSTFFVHLHPKKREVTMYKGLFHQIVSLLSAPGEAWDKIMERGGARDIQSGFVYPIIGLCGLSEFIGTFIGRDFSSLMFQLALTRCCAVAVALFGGFFLSAYLLNKLGMGWLKRGDAYGKMLVFVGYSMVVTFVLDIISGLVSIDLLHWILQIYTLVVVFEGVRRWLEVPERQQMAFTIVATLVILICPALIEYLFNQLSVILN